MERRKFIEYSSKSIVGAGIAVSSPNMFASQKKVAPSDRVRLGLIGCRGIGWADLNAVLKVPGVEFVSLCDVDQNVLNERSAELEKRTGKKTINVGDFRKVLDMKDVDAVFVCTPDHWHALPMIYACQAGKDVYVEKPLSNSIEECLTMVKAQKRYNNIVQVGQQQRSGQHWQNAIAFVHAGKLGKLRMVKAWSWLDWKGTVPIVPDEPVPAGVDYDMWLGPAPKRPFNRNRFHFTFRWFWDYAGGLMTDWGVHMLDMVLFGTKAGGPNSVVAAGGKYAFPDDAMQTPDMMNAVYEFDDFLMSWEHTIGIGRGPYDRSHGVAFIGSEGTLIVDRSGWEVISEFDPNNKDMRAYKMTPVPLQRAQGDDRDPHTANFIDCIKTRNKPICDIETGANVAINAHLGNIAIRLGKKVYWDKVNQKFINDPQAQELANAHYRDPWKLPVF
jgi:predicted dehydrogenase